MMHGDGDVVSGLEKQTAVSDLPTLTPAGVLVARRATPPTRRDPGAGNDQPTPRRARPMTQSAPSVRHIAEVLRAPSSGRCTNSFATTAALLRASWPSSGTPRGRPSDSRVVRPAVPCASWLAARRTICRCSGRWRRSRLACRVNDAFGEPPRRLSRYRTRRVVGTLSNWKRMRSVSGRPSSSIADRWFRRRSASEASLRGGGRRRTTSQ